MKAKEILEIITKIDVNCSENSCDIQTYKGDEPLYWSYCKEKQDNLNFALEVNLRKIISVYYRENNIKYDNTTWFVDDLAELKELVKVKFKI